MFKKEIYIYIWQLNCFKSSVSKENVPKKCSTLLQVILFVWITEHHQPYPPRNSHIPPNRKRNIIFKSICYFPEGYFFMAFLSCQKIFGFLGWRLPRRVTIHPPSTCDKPRYSSPILTKRTSRWSSSRPASVKIRRRYSNPKKVPVVPLLKILTWYRQHSTIKWCV